MNNIHVMYKPSKKGLAKGLSLDDRIVFYKEHYVWFKVVPTGYRFDFGEWKTGDVLEWKPKFKKPDSLWVEDGMINMTVIQNVENISEDNVERGENILQEIGVI